MPFAIRFPRFNLRRLAHLHPARLLRAPRILRLTGAIGATPVVVDASEASPTSDPLAIRLEAELDGLVCGLCAVRTESALAGVDGVERVEVDLATQRATLHLAPDAAASEVTREHLQRALQRAVIGMTIRTQLERITSRITHRLRRRTDEDGSTQ